MYHFYKRFEINKWHQVSYNQFQSLPIPTQVVCTIQESSNSSSIYWN